MHQGLTNETGNPIADADNPVPISSEGITISQTPAITAGAYIAGDTVGGLLTFANAARITGGGGVIKDVKLIDDAGQDVELELWLFNQIFTPIADNTPWDPSEADLENWIATITIETYFAAGTESVANPDASKRYDLVGTSLFGQLVTRGAPTYAATDDITVKVGLLQD